MGMALAMKSSGLVRRRLGIPPNPYGPCCALRSALFPVATNQPTNSDLPDHFPATRSEVKALVANRFDELFCTSLHWDDRFVQVLGVAEHVSQEPFRNGITTQLLPDAQGIQNEPPGS